ncbi:MAG TPA: hypothetical protein VMV94_20950 [Phycisphaerae bacterium]|nr:hypothetical protein [Phycisphaerae bacterium]
MAPRKLAVAVLVLLMGGPAPWSPSAFAQPQPSSDQPPPAAETQRLRGIIDKDQTWSGTIIITDDLTIQDATVTVSPGTTIEFAQAGPEHPPTLTVGSAASATGELKVLGTAQQPVTFRTHEGTNAGRVIINVRSRLIPSSPQALGSKPAAQPAVVPNEVTWRYVRFENLGHLQTKPGGGGTKTQVAEPAIAFNATGGAHTLQISECSFAKCCRLEVRAAEGAKVSITGNRFGDEKERVAIEVIAGEGDKGTGSLVVSGNTASAAINVDGAADIIENILVGVNAAIVLRNSGAAEAKICGNYVHNLAQEDDGRYCLNCEDPGALIDGNVLRGGTTCVLNGSKRVSGNVFIAALHLTSKYVKSAHTHQLVGALPPGATFERNLLLGPAYSMLVPQPAALAKDTPPAKGPTIIRHNLFDGFSDSNRAVHLNTAGRSSAPVAILNNVFLRVTTLVYDEGKTENTLTYEDYNAIAPEQARRFDQVQIAGIKMGSAGWGAKDIQLPDIGSMQLSAVFKEPPGDFDDEISARKVSISELRRRLFAAYRPLVSSPLVRAGRGDSGSEEASGPRPTIGPSEPGKE